MVLVTLWWWVSISVMVDRSGRLVWCGGGEEREKERERERERERGNEEPDPNPTRCHFYL